MFRVWLGLGSNRGDRKHYLQQAIQAIQGIAPVEKISSIYETEPVGMEPTDTFYNMVVQMTTHHLPPELLKRLKTIESLLGRKSDTHLQPREIDIDIEMYDSYIYRDPIVEVPHPEFHKRNFVLIPMNEIAPDIVHQTLNKSVSTLCSITADNHSVVRAENGKFTK